MKLDILKRFENEYLQFSRADFKTDPFHKIFLQQYFKAYPEEYRGKLQMYFSQSERALLFAGFLFQTYQGKKIVDPNSVRNLVDIQVLSELDDRIMAIKTQVFSSSNLANRDLYLAQRDEIFKLVKTFKTPKENVPKKGGKSSTVKSLRRKTNLNE